MAVKLERLRKFQGEKNYQVSRRRIGPLMRAEELFCKTKKKFKATTNSKHDKPIAPNKLNREYTATKPNQKWVGDITYIWTAEGWFYQPTVIDLYSGKVVG